MGGGEKEITTYRYTVTTRMTRALRWAAMSESHFNVSLIVKTASTDTTFEEKGEPKRIRTEVPLFTSLTVTPVQTGTSVTGRVTTRALSSTEMTRRGVYTRPGHTGKSHNADRDHPRLPSVRPSFGFVTSPLTSCTGPVSVSVTTDGRSLPASPPRTGKRHVLTQIVA